MSGAEVFRYSRFDLRRRAAVLLLLLFVYGFLLTVLLSAAVAWVGSWWSVGWLVAAGPALLWLRRDLRHWYWCVGRRAVVRAARHDHEWSLELGSGRRVTARTCGEAWVTRWFCLLQVRDEDGRRYGLLVVGDSADCRYLRVALRWLPY